MIIFAFGTLRKVLLCMNGIVALFARMSRTKDKALFRPKI